MSGLYEAWRAGNDGWSALICEPLLREALGHLGVGLPRNAVILDPGCGFGHVASAPGTAGHRALGADPDPGALLDALPPLRRAAWMVAVCGTR